MAKKKSPPQNILDLYKQIEKILNLQNIKDKSKRDWIIQKVNTIIALALEKYGKPEDALKFVIEYIKKRQKELFSDELYQEEKNLSLQELKERIYLMFLQNLSTQEKLEDSLSLKESSSNDKTISKTDNSTQKEQQTTSQEISDTIQSKNKQLENIQNKIIADKYKNHMQQSPSLQTTKNEVKKSEPLNKRPNAQTATSINTQKSSNQQRVTLSNNLNSTTAMSNSIKNPVTFNPAKHHAEEHMHNLTHIVNTTGNISYNTDNIMHIIETEIEELAHIADDTIHTIEDKIEDVVHDASDTIHALENKIKEAVHDTHDTKQNLSGKIIKADKKIEKLTQKKTGTQNLKSSQINRNSNSNRSPKYIPPPTPHVAKLKQQNITYKQR